MNKVVIITGASAGLGKELAFAFSKRGYSLGLLARRKELLNKTQEECLSFGAKNVITEVVDIKNTDQQRNALQNLITTLGKVDIFIANAGVSCIQKPLQDNGVYIRKAIGINFTAAADGIEFIRTLMIKQNFGTLVGITSIAQAKGMPLNGTYCATKAALHIFLQGLRIDLAKTPINVIEVAPGFIATDMTKKNKFFMPFLMKANVAAEAICKGIIAQKKKIVVPTVFKFLSLLLRLMPNTIYEWVASKKTMRSLY